MSEQNKKLTFAALLYVGLCVLVLVAPRLAVEQPDSVISIAARERIAINAKEDCYLYNGADLIAYSDDHSTAKLYLMGNTGNVGIGGTLVVTGELTAAGGAIYAGGSSFTDEVYGANGLRVTNNITGVSAAGVLRFGQGYITTTLDTNAISVTSGITGATLALSGAANITGAITTAGVFSSTGNVFSYGNLYGTWPAGSLTYGAGVFTKTLSANTFESTNAITAGGTLRSVGIAYLQSGVVTSTLAANTLSTTDAITAGGVLRVVGASTLTGTVTTIAGLNVGTIANVGTFLQYTAGTTQTVVNTQPITPTATYQHIAASVNVFTDNLLRAGALTGQLWILQNIGTPTITITDANTCNLASTYAMGISDTLALIFDGTSWNELYRSNN